MFFFRLVIVLSIESKTNARPRDFIMVDTIHTTRDEEKFEVERRASVSSESSAKSSEFLSRVYPTLKSPGSLGSNLHGDTTGASVSGDSTGGVPPTLTSIWSGIRRIASLAGSAVVSLATMIHYTPAWETVRHADDLWQEKLDGEVWQSPSTAGREDEPEAKIHWYIERHVIAKETDIMGWLVFRVEDHMPGKVTLPRDYKKAAQSTSTSLHLHP